MQKKKVKIISEKVKEQFKEIKEETEEKAKEEEENLEEEVEGEEAEQFQDFNEFAGENTGREIIAPVLEASREVQEAPEFLEETLENVPSTTTEQISYEKVMYNMPEYSYEKEAVPERREMRERGFIVSREEMGEIKPRVEMENWHEIRQAEQARTTPRDVVIETEPISRERKLPFEERKKYRRVKG